MLSGAYRWLSFPESTVRGHERTQNTAEGGQPVPSHDPHQSHGGSGGVGDIAQTIRDARELGGTERVESFLALYANAADELPANGPTAILVSLGWAVGGNGLIQDTLGGMKCTCVLVWVGAMSLGTVGPWMELIRWTCLSCSERWAGLVTWIWRCCAVT